jgi:hypothetical protein
LETVEIMHTGQAIIENHAGFTKAARSSTNGGIGGWVTRVFGCWHMDMSRPFSSEGQTYRTCVACGARRQFNLRRWEMQGDFYYGLAPRRQS